MERAFQEQSNQQCKITPSLARKYQTFQQARQNDPEIKQVLVLGYQEIGMLLRATRHCYPESMEWWLVALLSKASTYKAFRAAT
jgi:hypothetical protein